MLDIPRRLSLPAQIEASLRKGIEEGVWEGYLPGERRLSEIFSASRPTIRSALCSLAREGWIEVRHGRRTRLRRPPAGRPAAAPRRVIGIVVRETFDHLAGELGEGLHEMRRQLAHEGFSTEVYVCPSHRGRSLPKGLEAFVRQHRLFGCVLISASRTVQQWFAERTLPTLILGTCHPAVRLPSLDIDYRAVCRHAAGVLLAKGHRHIALVISESGAAGDLASEQGFAEAASGRAASGVRISIARHNGTAPSLAARLDTLFRSAHPPTALLVARTRFVFIALFHLLSRGHRVPETVSVIARDGDRMFESLDPPLAHYAVKREAYVRQLCRLMHQLLRGHPPPEPVRILPKFLAGKTVAPARW